jgi:hypothetical protein
MGDAGHLMQHAAGEAWHRQMRMDLGGAERQARSDAAPLMPLNLGQVRAQCGEPDAPVGG